MDESKTSPYHVTSQSQYFLVSYENRTSNIIIIIYIPQWNAMNSLSEQKILKIDDTGNKFSKILGKYYETYIHSQQLF